MTSIEASVATAYNRCVSQVFTTLATDADLDRLLEASHHDPVIIFKHSESCGASLMAEALLAEAMPPAPVHQLVVQRHRPVSNRIAAELGVRHESPQAIIVARGVAVWRASHAGVRPERLAAAYAEARAAMHPRPVSA